MKYKALKRLYMDGKYINVGDEFEAKDLKKEDIKILLEKKKIETIKGDDNVKK